MKYTSIKRLFFIIIFTSLFSSVNAVSAKIAILDIEYDFSVNSSVINCTYQFSWSTISGSMTGFYYSFPNNAKIITEKSYAIVNGIKRLGLTFEIIDNKIDICLQDKMRFSGTCDYYVFLEINKIENNEIVIESTKFDIPIDILAIGVVFNIEDSENVDIISNCEYSVIDDNKYGNECILFRIEEKAIPPYVNKYMLIRKKEKVEENPTNYVD